MCRIPFTAIAALLQLLQLLCPPDNKLPRSVYVWKKFFQRQSSKYTKLRYCYHCNQQLSIGDKKCSGADCQEVNHKPNTVIVLRPDKAIRRIFLREYTKLVIALNTMAGMHHVTLQWRWIHDMIFFLPLTLSHSLSLSLSLSLMLGNWKTMDSYTLSRPCSAYYDIHTGKGYQTLVHPDSIGTFFNTDGISPFKFSCLTGQYNWLSLACHLASV